jgi:hypothetical protein
MLTAQCHMALRKALYYAAQHLKRCSRAREALALAPGRPRGLEGQQRAGESPVVCHVKGDKGREGAKEGR